MFISFCKNCCSFSESEESEYESATELSFDTPTALTSSESRLPEWNLDIQSVKVLEDKVDEIGDIFAAMNIKSTTKQDRPDSSFDVDDDRETTPTPLQAIFFRKQRFYTVHFLAYNSVLRGF